MVVFRKGHFDNIIISVWRFCALISSFPLDILQPVDVYVSDWEL